MVNLQLIQSYVDPDQEVLYDVHSCFEQCEVRGIEKKNQTRTTSRYMKITVFTSYLSFHWLEDFGKKNLC